MRLAAGGLAARGGRAAGGGLHRYLLLHLAAHHARASHLLLARDAAHDLTRGLIGNLLVDRHAASFGNGPGYTLAGRDLALFFPDLLLANLNPAFDRDVLAHALHAGHRVLLPDRAGYPNANGLGPWRGTALRLAAVVVVAQVLQPVTKAGTARHFLAFIMTLVHTLALDARHRFAGDVPLHHGAFFFARNADTDLANDFLLARLRLVDRARDGTRFRDALAAIGGVRFLLAHLVINGARSGVGFGDPLIDANSAALRGTRGGRGCARSRLGGIFGAGGQRRRGHETASQHGNANMLPDHAFSFVALHADPGRHRDTALGRTGQPMWLNVLQLCANLGTLVKTN